MENRDFLKTNFGIEIEMTGIKRKDAAEIIAKYLDGQVFNPSIGRNTYEIKGPDGRIWKVVYDSSIKCQKKSGSRITNATSDYSVELVSPILNYDQDIESLQEMIRALRKAGAFSKTENTTGIHIHLDGKHHTSRSLRNFINIVYSQNDLLYKALAIEPVRRRYCKNLDRQLVEKMNAKKPKTLNGIEEIWYEGYFESRTRHYHKSRYQFLNLHSFFNGQGTVELRGFNGTLHAGKIRAYIVLALAMNNQALTQKYAKSKKVTIENPKFFMRTWLNGIGFIGEEFKNCREHLAKHLEGSAAWRFEQVS